MAQNLTNVKKRMASIKTAQKITKTMKLISMSKVQRYLREQQKVANFFNELNKWDKQVVTSTGESVVLCFGPDLGLVSIYNKSLLETLRQKDYSKLIWLGQHGLDRVFNQTDFEVLNQPHRSEKLLMDELLALIPEELHQANLYVAKAKLVTQNQLDFEIIPLNYELVFDEFQLYEPNFKEVNLNFKSLILINLLYESWLHNKLIEHRLRQIGMDKAEKSADEMLEQLTNVYNRIRQDNITQEISEIIGGREMGI